MKQTREQKLVCVEIYIKQKRFRYVNVQKTEAAPEIIFIYVIKFEHVVYKV